MEATHHHHQQQHQQQHSSSSSAKKTERKVIEKNRRNYMKTLYSTLFSLLPHHTSKEGLAVNDQIDEAIQYIKTLKANLEKSQDIKNKLMKKKRSHTCLTTETASSTSSKSPRIEIHQMGLDQDLILINGLNNQSTFYEIIRVIHEEGAEVLHANFSASGNSVFQLGRGNIGGSAQNFDATKIYNKVKELINGSTCCSTEVEPQLGLWDFEIEPDLWEFLNAEVNNPMGVLG